MGTGIPVPGYVSSRCEWTNATLSRAFDANLVNDKEYIEALLDPAKTPTGKFFIYSC